MHNNILKIKKAAEDFVSEYKKINNDKQEIQVNHIEYNEVGKYHQIEGIIKNRYTNPSSYPGSHSIFSDIFSTFFNDHSNTEIPKECKFTIKISEEGEVTFSHFDDIDSIIYSSGTNTYNIEPGLLTFEKSATDVLDSLSKFDKREAEADLLKEITQDKKDNRKRRRDIL